MKKIIGICLIITIACGLNSTTHAVDCHSSCALEIVGGNTSTPAYVSCMKKCESEEEEKKTCLQENSGETTYCDCVAGGGIKLNTNFPLIGRCIPKGNDSQVLGGIATAFTNIIMTLILTGGFAMIIRGGAQVAMGQTKEGKQKVISVIIAFAALGSLGIILRLINPNFFK